MNQTFSHIATEHRLDGIDESFFQAVDLPLVDKEHCWRELTARLDLSPGTVSRAKVIRRPLLKYAAAATILLIMSACIWASTYTLTVQTQQQAETHVLPDGSTIALSAHSVLSFHPYWWGLNRELSFEGEGYFQVEKGATFKVVSVAGTTEVLGTSFTINTLDNGYSVFCETGRVKVSTQKESLELAPGELAQLNGMGHLDVQSRNILDGRAFSLNNQFTFDERALKEVLDELSQHYEVQIELSETVSDTTSYTGFFTRPNQVEDALHIVSLSLGLTFDKEENGRFKVSR